ncbi:MAG: VWA domain-containing protein [Chloroflexi bacterium]|nr:VWA domain-containing protein [Chloroflexota bacterium]
MRRRFFLLAFILAIGALTAVRFAPFAVAQDPDPAPSLTINQLDASAYPQLRAIVTVLDGRGVPARGLLPAQFQAFDGNTQLSVTGAVAAMDQDLQLNAVITIDVSGSMEGEPLASAKAAATEFVQSLGPNDRAAIISFSDEVTPVLPLTNDKTALIVAIAGLQAGGGTALYEGVQVSAYLAGTAATQGQRAVAIILSDGENATETSDATGESSLQIAQGSGIPIYPIGFGSLTDVPYLESLAAVTSGQFRAATTGTITDVYAELSDLLRSQYIVTVRDDSPADGSDGTLQIVAFVGPSPAASIATFKRGAPAPPPVPAAQPADPSPLEEGNGSGNRYALVFGGVVALVALGGAAVAFRRWQAQRRTVAHQLQVVAPNARLAAAQGVPRRMGAYAPAGNVATLTVETGTGRLVERGGEGRDLEIGSGPLILGTSPRRCQVVLHDGGSIAPEHARIWLRGGRYVLHHVGGMSRKTLVNGQEADWVALDPGDEIVIGQWRFLFEDGSEPAT